MANRTTVVFVLFMLMTTSLMALAKDTFILEDEDLIESSSKSTTTAAEIASWRIGDKWTYETQFDVAQLLHKQTFLQV